jgi:hypothetical protein
LGFEQQAALKAELVDLRKRIQQSGLI